LDTAKDYILAYPSTKKIGTLEVNGGRNIHIIGGHGTSKTGSGGSVLAIKGATGTVHIEGLLIDNSAGGGDFDGIRIAAPNAIVQIQKCRIVGLTGTSGGVHADVVQPYGGYRELRIDRLTGSSNYQGLFLGEHDAPGQFGPMTIQNVNLQSFTGPNTQSLIWMTDSYNNWLMNYSVSFSNVYLQPLSGKSVGRSSVVPNIFALAPYAAVQVGTTVAWPNLLQITGTVYEGVPPGGDFVPAGTVGIGY